MAEITASQKITVLKHLVNGKDRGWVALATTLSVDEVLDIASRHGYPDVEKMKWAIDVLSKPSTPERPAAPVPPGVRRGAGTVPPGDRARLAAAGTPQPRPATPLGDLLASAKRSPKKRTQALGAKCAALLGDLARILHEEEKAAEEAARAAQEKARNAARIAELKAELARLQGQSKPRPAETPLETARHGCGSCGRTFGSAHGLQVHVGRTHGSAA